MKKLMAWLLLGAILLIPLGQAFGAISITLSTPTVFGNKRIALGTLDLDSSYRNGGETVTAANLGLMNIDYVQFTCDNDGYLLQYDYSAEKVVAFAVLDSLNAALIGPLVDAASGTTAVDLSGVTDIRIFAIGN